MLTLTINEKQCWYCNTVKYNTEIDQSAASIRVELMMKYNTIKAFVKITHVVQEYPLAVSVHFSPDLQGLSAHVFLAGVVPGMRTFLYY